MFNLVVHDINRAVRSLKCSVCFVFGRVNLNPLNTGQCDAYSSHLQPDKQGWDVFQPHVKTVDAVAFVSSMFSFQTACNVFSFFLF